MSRHKEFHEQDDFIQKANQIILQALLLRMGGHVVFPAEELWEAMKYGLDVETADDYTKVSAKVLSPEAVKEHEKWLEGEEGAEA